ncbi:hypothetical protein PQ462_09805 [Flavobacterium sp. KACC 22758]|uniref:hypothetical protein n=1 Tax=Flavobacterium sp. KACC 22758 TaxID=3025667 RepID=UPI002366E9D4|nr:hypothetical protein [Flavobacterium sp. KACC 22758]WDF61666.1 hypothetical protein PQ462_09805 [Flavobacterium sp. KACC 22758]
MKDDPNVVYLKHIGEFEEADLDEISKKLSIADFELDVYNGGGKVTASLEDFSFISFLALNSPIMIEFLKGVGTNAGWDVMKQVIILARSKVLGKKYHKLTSTTREEKEITFGLKIKLDKNSKFDFELKGNLSDEVIGESLDKALDFLKAQMKNTEYKHPPYLRYSTEEKKWITVDVLEEIRKKHKKQNL